MKNKNYKVPLHLRYQSRSAYTMKKGIFSSLIVRYSVFMLRKNYKFGQMAHFLCDEDLNLMLGQRQDFEEI